MSGCYRENNPNVIDPARTFTDDDRDPAIQGCRSSPSTRSFVMSTRLLIASAIAAAVALPVVAQEKATEKCYGVVKAAKNDCQTATSSCAGTSKKDGQGDAWIALPKGTCEKIVGASLTAKKG
jgi:uncharacterized membrane protein